MMTYFRIMSVIIQTEKPTEPKATRCTYACHCHASNPKGLNTASATTTNVVLIILVVIVSNSPCFIRGTKVALFPKTAKPLLTFLPFIPKSTVRHTVCHKHGLNIPNICRCCNFILPLHQKIARKGTDFNGNVNGNE
ncbi:MAG: hypothetical protein K6A98_07575 [Prevotella sp.]|nr:hypothetical protein [Prevotella sp.]